jgi:hypothetical protein
MIYFFFYRIPRTRTDWKQISLDFEKLGGFPDIAGAIDGSLFKVERPFDYDG